MIPLRDTIKSRRRPVVTWALIALNTLVFAFEISLDQDGLRALFFTHGIVPAEFSLPTLITSTFLHGGLLHLVSNMWMLWIFGDNVEDRLGRMRYLLFYMACGVAAGAIHSLTELGSAVPTIGASGAIAGVLGAYFLLYPRARVVTLVPLFFWPLFFEVPAYFFLGFWFLTQVLSGGLAVAGATASGIAWWAHVGGFVTGLVLHRMMLPKVRPRALPGL